jgi:hypothetical protein
MNDNRGPLGVRTSRRGLFRLGAAGLLAPVGAGTTAADDGSDGESNGRLVFIYDDSWREDWDQTFPVHQEEGVPACCAAVTEYVDTGWGLLPEHLHEMESEGWEIMSHTASHGVVGNLYLTAPAEPDDRRLSLNASFLADHDGEPIVVADDDGTVESVIAGGGEDENGFYLELEEPIGESFAAEETFVRFTDERIREEVVGSKEELEEMGVDVDYFVSPFGRSEGLVEELVAEHYAGFANREGDGLNGLTEVDPYDLGRTSIDGRSSTETEIEGFYDRVAAGNYLGIVVGHSQFDETTEERVRFAIQEAKERNLEIVTLREALSELDAGPDEMLGAEEDDEENDDSETGSDDGGRADDGEAATNESASDSSGDGAGPTVRENGPAIAAGTGLLATVAVAGRAAYQRIRE